MTAPALIFSLLSRGAIGAACVVAFVLFCVVLFCLGVVYAMLAPIDHARHSPPRAPEPQDDSFELAELQSALTER